MTRIRAVTTAGAVFILAMTGCVAGSIDVTTGADGGPGTTAEQVAARQSFDSTVKPLLDGFCAACHTATPGIQFLADDPDVYTSVMTWPRLVDVASPRDSRLVSKGAHDGPAWTIDQASTIRDWIALEVIAAGGEGGGTIETPAFSPVLGQNTVDLSSIGLAGSSVTFRLEQLTVGLYLTEIMVHAGTGGARLVHPLFVTWVDDTPTPDPIDRFSDIDLLVPEAGTSMLGGGTLVLVDVPPTAMLSIHFAVAEAADGGGNGDDGGIVDGSCRDVGSFSANARQTLSQNCAAACHGGGNTSATNATDMRGIDDLSAEVQAAVCAQIRSRVNLGDPINSGIFIAPDPNSGSSHPFKFGGNVGAFNGFRDSLLIWINQEQE